jgi:hypothetical protein
MYRGGIEFCAAAEESIGAALRTRRQLFTNLGVRHRATWSCEVVEFTQGMNMKLLLDATEKIYRKDLADTTPAMLHTRSNGSSI